MAAATYSKAARSVSADRMYCGKREACDASRTGGLLRQPADTQELTNRNDGVLQLHRDTEFTEFV